MVCPLCTIAVAVGVGVLETWGVDRILIGIWFGALIVSSIMWFVDGLNRKKIRFQFRTLLISSCFYAIFILPMYYIKVRNEVLMGNGVGEVFGLDRLLFGIIIGSIVFLLSVLAHNNLKRINNGTVLFFWQKAIIPVVFLIIASIISFFSIKIVGI
jgi:hypothetical protein